MSLRISKKALIHYILIYFMLILTQSNFYNVFIDGNATVQLVILLVLAAYLFCRHSKAFMSAAVIAGVLLLFVIFVRYTTGGVGITFWYEIALKVLVVYVAISFDPENFVHRLLKILAILAVISLIGWAQQIAGLDILTRVLPGYETGNYYTTYDYSGNSTTTYQMVHGLFFYSSLDSYPSRNCGIFTEPGIYQMVLNSAIFLLLFFEKYTDLEKKQSRNYLIIFVITLLTTQSTSGYFGIAVILVAALISKNREQTRWKKYLLRIVLAGVLVLALDYMIRGSDSFLSTAILGKVINDTSQFDLSATTGQYRLASIGMSILAMIQHPLGMGWTGYLEFSSVNELAGAGGYPFKLGAVIGVIPFIVTMVWIFRPMKYVKNNPLLIIVFIFLYFNSSLAQTSAFYPALIMIPVYLRLRSIYGLGFDDDIINKFEGEEITEYETP